MVQLMIQITRPNRHKSASLNDPKVANSQNLSVKKCHISHKTFGEQKYEDTTTINNNNTNNNSAPIWGILYIPSNLKQIFLQYKSQKMKCKLQTNKNAGKWNCYILVKISFGTFRQKIQFVALCQKILKIESNHILSILRNFFIIGLIGSQ